MAGRVRVETEGAVAWIVFDHAERRNAVTLDMWKAIPAAAARLAADEAVRVVVLRGAGEEAFVAGADISEFEASRNPDTARTYEEANLHAFEALASLPKPVLAAIHGFAIGGGLAIALTADLRYGADDAVLAIPAARLGLGYPAAGLERLAQTVGHSTAKEILFTARRLTAVEALRRGLLTEVLPKAGLDEHVRRVAGEIAANAPLTIRSVKTVLGEIARGARDSAAAAESIRACFASEDYKEGVRAFLEKRKAAFRGR